MNHDSICLRRYFVTVLNYWSGHIGVWFISREDEAFEAFIENFQKIEGMRERKFKKMMLKDRNVTKVCLKDVNGE